MSRALIVSQFVETRVPLLQIATRCSRFKEVFSVHNLEEAYQSIQGSEKIEYIFLSNTFGQEQIAAFVERVKKTPGRGECAFVMVLGKEGQETSTIASNMLVGIHGFICEPLSAENVERAAQLASAVRLQESGVRLRAATGLMLAEVMEANDPQKGDGNRGSLWNRVQESCERFKELTGESVSVSVVRELQEAPPSKRIPKYNGVSSRVRSVFERKFKEHLQRMKKRP